MSTASDLRKQARRKRKWMQRHRRIRRARARAGRYFWLPCPLCGEESGGHEWVGRIVLPVESGTPDVDGGRGVCPACELELGAKAAEMCERDGHDLRVVFGSGPIPFVRDGAGNNIGRVSVDLAKPAGAYCASCGIELPVPTDWAGIDGKESS